MARSSVVNRAEESAELNRLPGRSMRNDAINLTRTLKLYRDGHIELGVLCDAIEKEISSGVSVSTLQKLLDIYSISDEAKESVAKVIRRTQWAGEGVAASITEPLPQEQTSSSDRESSTSANLKPSRVASGHEPTGEGVSLDLPVVAVDPSDVASLPHHSSVDRHMLDPVGVGVTLDQRFELVRRIGAGGESTVYEAFDVQADKRVAVKILNIKMRAQLSALVAFEEEAKIATELKHPTIVDTLHYSIDDIPYIVMELLNGETLETALARLPSKMMPFSRVAEIASVIGAALSYMHKSGVVHCDVNPKNVFLTSSGDVKLIDFGVARALSDGPGTGLSPTIVRSTTIAFASPEILELRHPDFRDDVFSFASTLYSLVEGYPPFGLTPATDARTVGLKLARPRGIPDNAWAAFQAALQFDTELRTSTVERFVRDLQPRRKLRWWPAAAAVALAGVAATWYFTADETFVSGSVAADNTTPAPTVQAEDARLLGVDRNPATDSATDDLAESLVSGHVEIIQTPTNRRADISDETETVANQSEQTRRNAPDVPVDSETIRPPPTKVPVRPPQAVPSETTNSVSRNPELPQPVRPELIPIQIRSVGHRVDDFGETVSIQVEVIGSASLVEAAVGVEESQNTPYTLYDDGTHGDSLSGDNVYEVRLPIVDPTSTIRYNVTVHSVDAGTVYSPPQDTAPHVIPPIRSAPPIAPEQQVYINELMADNNVSAYDPQGDYDDWIELYNPTATSADLGGMYLTDNRSSLRKWRIPQGVKIPPYGYLLVWADDQASYTRSSAPRPELHASFTLNERGGQILFVDKDANENTILDEVEFGRLRQDFVLARKTGNGKNFEVQVRGTPGSANR